MARRRRGWRLGVMVPVLALMAFAAATPPASATTVTVAVDPSNITGQDISPLLFGANHRYGLNGSGASDPATGLTYPSVESAIEQNKLSMIRYPGGTMANTFQFDKAIGAQSTRSNQVNGQTSAPLPLDSTFGPDEYGKLLDDTGTTGDLMLNFVTETAQKAADFVSYMTGTPGVNTDGGTDWAQTRADNGHTAPYPISYAEISNEPYYQGQTYWMGGTPVSYTDSSCASVDKVACLYAFGGTTSFTGQRLSQPDDWRDSAGVGTGAADQSYVIRYAPVVGSATTVYVNGVAWTQVGDLSSVGAVNAYALNPATGKVTFGDGTHGNKPPSGAVLTSTYQSGPHEGFVDFYAAIKQVALGLPVCSSLDTKPFFQVMGSSHPYDCVVVHPYVSDPKTYTDADDYMGQLMNTPAAQATTVSTVHSDMATYAGSRAAQVSLLLSEYGSFGGNTQYPNSLMWMSQALLNAQQLRNWILAQTASHVVGAERHALIDYTFSAPPKDLQVSHLNNVLFGGPVTATQGPVTEPAALAIQLMSKMAGQDRIKNSVTNNPSRTLSNGATLTSLVPLGSKDAAGNVLITVINRDPTNDVSATVTAGSAYAHTGSVDSWTLAGSSYQSYNTRTSPNAVQIDQASTSVGTGNFTWNFPAHSITVLELHPA
ncbi:hypothetical protein [Streptomyces sp. NPDC047028]|uniref:hypothetical protein n=1 Tax=Streptomyces sp. NPDC047028 TaxID=3155793 RepID=UPI0033D311D9